MKKKYYKIVEVDGSSVHGGNLTWSLPQKNGARWTPGEWHEVSPPIRACSHGLHLVIGVEGLMRWYKSGTVVYEAEGAGEQSGLDGIVAAFQKARLLRPAKVRMPSYWKKVIGFIEQEIPAIPWFKPDGKPNPDWKLYAGGSWAAAWDAAWDAANAAADTATWDAARNAANAAARKVARNAARNVARNVANAAAWDAAWDAANAAVRNAGAPAGAAGWAAQLQAHIYVCDGLAINKKHIEHAAARWEVWKKGYALLCDVDGVLYVYSVS